MNEAEKLLEKFARKNMVQWNQESFKRTHSRLHKSIIEALNEALRIPVIVEQSEQFCEHKGRRTATELVESYEDCPNCGSDAIGYDKTGNVPFLECFQCDHNWIP